VTKKEVRANNSEKMPWKRGLNKATGVWPREGGRRFAVGEKKAIAEQGSPSITKEREDQATTGASRGLLSRYSERNASLSRSSARGSQGVLKGGFRHYEKDLSQKKYNT